MKRWQVSKSPESIKKPTLNKIRKLFEKEVFERVDSPVWEFSTPDNFVMRFNAEWQFIQKYPKKKIKSVKNPKNPKIIRIWLDSYMQKYTIHKIKKTFWFRGRALGFTAKHTLTPQTYLVDLVGGAVLVASRDTESAQLERLKKIDYDKFIDSMERIKRPGEASKNEIADFINEDYKIYTAEGEHNVE